MVANPPPDEHVSGRSSLVALESRIDRDLRYAFVSPAHHEVTGLDAQAVGERVEDVLTPAVYRAREPMIQQTLTGTPVTFEGPFQTLAGRPVHLITTMVPVLDREGKPVAVISVEIDVTEERREQAVLRDSEERFRTLIENADDMIQKVDGQGRILFVNRAWKAKLGYTDDDIAKMNAFDVIHPDSLPHCRAVFTEVFGGHAVGDIDVVFVAKDGRRVVAEGSVAPRWVGGRIVATHGYFRDVTDRRRLEAESRLHRQRLESAEADAGLGSWEVDFVTGDRWWSPQMYVLFGLDPASGAPPLKGFLECLHPDDRPVIAEAFAAMRAGQMAPVTEFRTNPDRGSELVLRPTYRVEPHEPGRGWRAVGTVLDITERKRLEAQFLQAQKMESVGRLAGGVAHDFNNLLTVINSTAELALLRVPAGDPLQGDLRDIHDAGDRASALTRQLLAFSRKQILQPRLLKPNAVVTDFRRMLRRLIDADIDIATDLANGVDQVQVDPGQLHQVLLNLCVNARDAMPDGGKLTITTRNLDVTDEADAAGRRVPVGRWVALSVTDTGIGMDAATRRRIFEPFFTTKPEGVGTGLGLATVFGIVQQSGGTVEVDSALGEGTTFTVLLPSASGVDEDARASDSAQAPATGTETILVVEDQDAVRRVAKRILELSGYTVFTAASGSKALAWLENHAGPLHLLITDVVMPGMSGFDLAGRMHEQRPAVRILYTSGYTDEEISRRQIGEGQVHFLPKPYRIDELGARVRAVLDE